MNSNHRAKRGAGNAGRRSGGFSLVEIVLAIGVVSFAFVSVLGLVPMGMNAFRSSIDTSVGAQIDQQMVNQAQETDFSTLIASGSPYLTTGTTAYFDVDGRQLPTPTGAIYEARASATGSSSLPGAPVNQNIATVTVQIANNPGDQALTVNPATNLWNPQSGVSMRTFSTFISGYGVTGTSGN